MPLDAAATTLGLPRTWLKSQADSGALPSILVGKRRLYDVEIVREALNRRAEQDGKSDE